MRFLLLFFGAIILLSSCVSNRKVVLLQKNDLHEKNLPIDSIVREYAIEKFDYKIQPNDIISVRFNSLTTKELDFFASYSNQQGGGVGNISTGGAQLIGELVDERGEIPVPVAGNIRVAGLTVFQIQDTLQKIANRYFEAPIVRVRLLNYRITLLGEVGREGSMTLGNNRVSMLEAIGLAGGLTDLADRSSVKLIRQNGDKTEVAYLNLLDENFFNSPYYYVNQNDVLIIPPLRQRPFRLYAGQNLALFVSTVSILLLTISLLQK